MSDASTGQRQKQKRKVKRRKTDSTSFAEEQEFLLKSLATKTPECPVLSITLPVSDSPPTLEIASEQLLEQLIHPISKQTFLEHAFRKKALHVTGTGTKSRIEGIIEELHQLDPEYLFQETSSDNVFVWLQQSDGKIQSLELQDPKQALLLHQIGGHATYCRAPPSVEQPMVANLLRATGFGCGQYDPSGESSISLGRGEVEVFIGTKSHTTQWHFDFQENFTIQLSGRKTWKLQQGIARYPTRACTPHYAAPDVVESQLKAMTTSSKFQFGNPNNARGAESNAVGKVDEVTLGPGDFSLQHLLLQSGDEGWRETIHHGSSSKDDVVRKLQVLLEKLPGIIQNFSNSYGAAAIIPPILRKAPSFQVDGHEKDFRSDDQGDGDDDGESDGGDDSDEEGDGVQVDEDADRHVLGAEVTDVSSFECPTGWSSASPGSGYALALNPLGWVRPVDEITSFYQPGERHPDLYVINFNYAGNELHESSVRLVVRDEQHPTKIRDELGPREECYLYHGFYCWRKD
ncbi:hypothetical protein MHU86_4215 [Fragilaria crotonensis]|nr:hypothetical protein MHU86_4215 [Fragilaria crotonensis]